jgi:replication factor C subunit 3/5
MRKVLNVLQATASGFETVDAATVYACTGNPTPADVSALLHALLNLPVAPAHAAVLALTRRGFALTDVLGQIAARVAQMALPADALKLLVTRLADVEYRLAFGTSDKVQGAALVGAFAAMRELLDEAKAGK